MVKNEGSFPTVSWIGPVGWLVLYSIRHPGDCKHFTKSLDFILIKVDLLGSFTSIITRFETPYEWKSRTSRASRASGLLFFVSDCGSKVELSLLRDSDSVSASSWNWIKQTIHSMNSEPIETQQKWENLDWLARRSVKVKAAATFLYSSTLSRWVSCAMQRLRNTCHWLCRLPLCACPGTVQPRPVTTTAQNQFLHFFHFDGAHRKCCWYATRLTDVPL